MPAAIREILPRVQGAAARVAPPGWETTHFVGSTAAESSRDREVRTRFFDPLPAP